MTKPRQPGWYDDDSSAARQTPLPVLPTPPPWYPRRGILIAAAFAALIAEVAITVSGPGDPGTAPGGTAGTSTPWSASFSLVATDGGTPDPTAPAAQHQTAPAAAAPHTALPPAAAPPPPATSQLVFRHEPLTAIVSITNNANRPAVGCVYRSVAVAGQATAIHYDHSVNFTVTGSAETRVRVGDGPATGSTFHVTVTCDNGLSTGQDVMY